MAEQNIYCLAVKAYKASIIAFCILVIPLFECICCEVEKGIQSCCNNQSSADQSCDVHPCLEYLITLES